MLLTRRELLSGLPAGTFLLPHLVVAQDASSLRINAARLQQSLEALSMYAVLLAEPWQMVLVELHIRMRTLPAGITRWASCARLGSSPESMLPETLLRYAE